MYITGNTRTHVQIIIRQKKREREKTKEGKNRIVVILNEIIW